jgi:hypothetical protein
MDDDETVRHGEWPGPASVVSVPLNCSAPVAHL